MTEQHDKALVKRVREAWGRPALSDAERAEFDAGLRTRIERRQPRRWIWAIASVTAMAAVAVALSLRGGAGAEADWFETLADAQAVVMGETVDDSRVLFYGFEASEDSSVPLFADPAWDPSADTVWDSNEALDLGQEYEVLAFWLAPATNGNDAANTPGVP